MFGPEARRFRGGAPSQNRFETARPFKARTHQLSGERGPRATPGVPSLTFLSDTRSGTTHISKNVKGGSLGKRDAVCCSGYEAGRRRAIGVVATSQSPTHDHADGATLGPGAPTAPLVPEGRGYRKPGSGTAAGTSAMPNPMLSSAVGRECPPQTLFGPYARDNREALVPNNDLERHVRSRQCPHTLDKTWDGCLALFSSDEKVPGIPSHRLAEPNDYRT